MSTEIGKTRDHYRNIDILKGVAAIFIITLHFPFSAQFRDSFFFPYIFEMAVPMFLFISGFLGSISFAKHNISGLSDAYSKKEICRKLLRILLPYCIFFVAENIAFRLTGIYTVSLIKYGLLALFFDFLTGGKGQGSYYIPVMVQFVFLFPLIFFTIKKWRFKGVLGTFLLNIAYEIIKTAYGMNEGEYRLLIFRYLFLIACGCYMGLEKENTETNVSRWNIPLMCLSALLGILYIYAITYRDHTAKIITYWQNTSVLAALYFGPVLILLAGLKLKFFPVEVIGRASFHIFLVQMLYYLYYDPGEGTIAGYFVSLAICIAAGLLFYFMESMCKKIYNYVKENNRGGSHE